MARHRNQKIENAFLYFWCVFWCKFEFTPFLWAVPLFEPYPLFRCAEPYLFSCCAEPYLLGFVGVVDSPVGVAQGAGPQGHDGGPEMFEETNSGQLLGGYLEVASPEERPSHGYEPFGHFHIMSEFLLWHPFTAPQVGGDDDWFPLRSGGDMACRESSGPCPRHGT